MQNFFSFLVVLFVSQAGLAAVLVEGTSSSGMEMRKTRRVGIGLVAAGAAGMAGTSLELNFSEKSGIVLGFGGGSPSYQTFGVQYKGVFVGEWLLPYYTFGYTHWENYGRKGPITETNPNFLADKFLTMKEKQEGKINENLIFPGIGIQYVKLGGFMAGSSLYLELQILMDIGDFVAAATGTFGYLYYF